MKEGDDDSREYPCLVRLSDGGKYKYSTQARPSNSPSSSILSKLIQVSSFELPKFHEAYGTLIKTSILGSLRKRDKKREKQRAEEAAKRKEKLSTPVVVDGKKRGAGRRRRQRQVKATIKQQAALQKVKERLDAKATASAKT